MWIIRNKWIAITVIALGFGGMVTGYWYYNRTSNPIPVKPDISEPVEETITAPAPVVIKTLLPDNYFFRQDDERWASDTIGDTDDTLHMFGCTISAVAMAASNLTGEEITPGALNKDLSDSNGFTDRGWLIWDAISKVTDDKVSALLYNQPDHDNIQACINDGHYPVVKILVNGNYVHWVLIVGTTEDDDYLIRDPLFGSEDDPERLSERTDKIHSVRCIVDNP